METAESTLAGWRVTPGERHEDRRNKRYWREILVTGPLPVRREQSGICLDVERRLGALLVNTMTRVRTVNNGFGYGQKDIFISLIAKASKPSEILDEVQADRLGMEIAALSSPLVERAVAHACETDRRQLAVDQCAQIVRQCVVKVLEAANVTVRYEERLAALKSDRDVAIKLASASLVAEWGNGEIARGDGGWEPEAIKAAPRLIAREALACANSGPFGTGVSVSEKDVIDFTPATVE